MRYRGGSRAAVGSFVAVVLAACGGKIDPNELAGTTSSSGSSGAGAVPTALPTTTASPVPPSTPTSVPGRPPPPPSEDCEVSFKGDILPVLTKNNCASFGCHNETSGVPQTEPYINDSDPVSTYKALTTYKILGQPYVDTSGNPASSSIMCNLRGDCGTRMPTFGRVSNKDLATIASWLRCSAPLN